MIRRCAAALSAVTVGAILGTTAPMAFEFPAHAQPAVCTPILTPVRIPCTDLIVIGDSLTSRTLAMTPSPWTYGQIRASGGRGAGIPGSDGATGRQVVETWAPQVIPGGWLVVELGINDIAQGVTPEAFAEFVVSTADLLPDDRCLGWVLPWGRDYVTGARAYAAAITAAIDAQPCHAVVGWVPTVTGWRTSDGVHLTPAGGQVLAASVYAAVGR